MLQQVKIINGQKVLVPLSGSTPTNVVERGNNNPVTSNAVARNNVYCIKDYWTEDSNNPYDILALAESFPDMPNASEVIKIRVGAWATNSPYGVGVQSCDFYYDIRKVNVSQNNWIRIIAYDVRDNQTYENAKLNGTWQGWSVIGGNISSGSISVNANVSNGTVTYVKKGNLCTVTLANVSLISWTGGDRTLNSSTSKLPKSIVAPYFSIPPINASTPSQVFYISTVGDLWAGGGVSQSGHFYGSFTYFCKN